MNGASHQFDIDTMDALLRVKLLADPALSAFIDQRHMNARISTTGDIYCVRPRPGTSDAVQLQVLKTRIRDRFPESKTRFVIQAIYRSWVDGLKDEINPEITRPTNQQIAEIIESAIAKDTSDMHVRDWQNNASMLFRINKSLIRQTSLKSKQASQIINGLFSLSDKRTSKDFDASQPNDSSVNFKSKNGRTYVLRMNTIPDVRGTTLVVRIRDPHDINNIEHCGYSESQVTTLKRVMRKSGGQLLFTGPTNSGKSTSQESLMASIDPHYYIIAVEDPVEGIQSHVSHIEVDFQCADAEAKLANISRALVRQDPDYLVLGEIRDERSARQAESMSLMGKFVMATLHTDSVVTAVPRLINLGMSADAIHAPRFINGIVSQNLVPVTCQSCALQEHPDRATHRYYQTHLPFGDIRYINPEGCHNCNHTGKTHLTIIAEILEFDRDVRKLIAEKKYDEIIDHMWSSGTDVKHVHALQKVLRGEIDPGQVESTIDAFSPDNIRNFWRVNEQVNDFEQRHDLAVAR